MPPPPSTAQYADDGRSRRAGLNIWDRPTDAPMRLQFEAAERVQGATAARRDSLRARLVGDSGDAARLEFLDEAGRVVSVYAQE